MLSLGGAGALQRMENGADTAPHGDAARPRMSLLSAKRKHRVVIHGMLMVELFPTPLGALTRSITRRKVSSRISALGVVCAACR